MENEDLYELMAKEEIEKLNLPSDLITFLTSSTRIKDKLYKKTLLDIEDLFLYYSSISTFSISDFCEHSITAISRANNIDSFYYYAKKILDENMTSSPKHKPESSDLQYINISRDKYLKIVSDAQKAFIEIVNSLYSKNKDLNLFEVYLTFGKLEFALEIESDAYLEKLLISGYSVLEDYLKFLKKEDKEEEEVIEKEIV